MKTIVTLALAAAVSSFAFAETARSSDISFKAGLFAPITNETKNATGSNWFAFGLEKDLKIRVKNSDPNFTPSLFLSLDYYGDNNFSAVPLMLNYRAQGKDLYFVAGGGLGFVRTPNGNGGASTENEFCYNFAVGKNFNWNNRSFFVEGRWLGSVENRLNGYGVWFGVRF